MGSTSKRTLPRSLSETMHSEDMPSKIRRRRKSPVNNSPRYQHSSNESAHAFQTSSSLPEIIASVPKPALDPKLVEESRCLHKFPAAITHDPPSLLHPSLPHARSSSVPLTRQHHLISFRGRNDAGGGSREHAVCVATEVGKGGEGLSKFTGNTEGDQCTDHIKHNLLKDGFLSSSNTASVNAAESKRHKRCGVKDISVERTSVKGSKADEHQVVQEVVEVPSAEPEIIVDENSADDLDHDTFGDMVSKTLNEDEQRSLQHDVMCRLESTPGLPVETGTKKMLAEFVVCMLLAGKRPSEVQNELKVFLNRRTTGFVAWLTTHLKELWFHAQRAHAGPTSGIAIANSRRQN